MYVYAPSLPAPPHPVATVWRAGDERHMKCSVFSVKTIVLSTKAHRLGASFPHSEYLPDTNSARTATPRSPRSPSSSSRHARHNPARPPLPDDHGDTSTLTRRGTGPSSSQRRVSRRFPPPGAVNPPVMCRTTSLTKSHRLSL